MHAAKFIVAIALCLTATLAQAAGFRFIEVPADADGPVLKGAMWYPCSEPPGEIQLGPFTLIGVKDCPISGDKLPLVVVSHGAGGSFDAHHDMAETLADAGFIVAAIDHPGHTHLDMTRSGDLSVFVERPTDITRLIDFMLGTSPVAPKIDPQRIGFFGFSAGGYTGLVLIGANPDWAIPFCTMFHDLREPSSAAPICEQILRKKFRVQPLAHDPRIKAAVIADSFAAVKVPVQLWASERGTELGRIPRCLRLKALPPWTEACRRSTSIMWCRTPHISPSYSSARLHWRRTYRNSARMRRASTASPSTSSSMRKCSRSFGHT